MSHLSVLENMLVGQHVRNASLGALLIPYRLIPGHRWKVEAREALAESGLAEWADETVGALPYGVRKRIDLVRATLAGASVLMLDEPAAGLNPSETNALRDHLKALMARGITLLVVEHDMHFVDSICQNVVVLNFGEKIAEGPLSQVRQRTPRCAKPISARRRPDPWHCSTSPASASPTAASTPFRTCRCR